MLNAQILKTDANTKKKHTIYVVRQLAYVHGRAAIYYYAESLQVLTIAHTHDSGSSCLYIGNNQCELINCLIYKIQPLLHRPVVIVELVWVANIDS